MMSSADRTFLRKVWWDAVRTGRKTDSDVVLIEEALTLDAIGLLTPEEEIAAMRAAGRYFGRGAGLVP
ncbi:hypothetical protein [Curtobacterium flaccumfaciens]|uniref:hypothetical protein n=1 Tax=Curtobacterium flaccumfaciens TaxID=2035 RepID=UPI00265ABCCB|nr:hypothetical protein [Curtobacterium flaccumfaciens]MCS5504224.1 hypothetical protein [Curtobacterium flaccumfaciens pv. flaccumfaciens]